ncbi:exopolysaccharide biosynthesis polyprenyl glycosylphosphotransferase [uncultured Polaribacter sp.]|uniref:exopolysaccharide biosynthesis polyprenyl glycosylphosphotransferase n=1 Tax=uncultured Polaribacter sp. TaxID=174711 RepID=UPI00262F25E6|nr:exopolysaccharide biosynthesis polyprenyl glycosylphosphotransferase [uncultured Polaribacter sp.]
MKKRYSYLLKPIQILLDIFIISSVIFAIRDKEYLNAFFLFFVLFFWLITSYYVGFYKVHRHYHALKIVTLTAKQYFMFSLGYFAYFTIFREGYVVNNQFVILSSILLIIGIVKFISFYLLKKYRSFGNNFRTTVVAGLDQSSKNMIKLFKSKTNLGYKYLGFFSDKKYKSSDYLGDLSQIYSFAGQNIVDEIYCSLSTLSDKNIKDLKKFTADKNISLKLIPDATELYSKNQSVEFYNDSLLVLNVKKLPFEFKENLLIKRVFDILFALFVCVFILSWIVPILWVLVKIESKGPLIFKQFREGVNGEEFLCYKFRSMRLNTQSNYVHATRNDKRVTRIGAFLRKSSIDELPQFINVLLGDMSVVGPRPHLESLSLEYQKDVDDYLKRHVVKPGITGLAQISGYRGEIKKKSDIKNRVRLDIFYIENWSFFLDVKIIIQTILDVFKGDEKAY